MRGVRFVRPALVVHDRATGAEKTLLATLDHKPWPALDGEPWVAAFPWKDGAEPDVARTELAVAPSIVVPLARAVDGVAVALEPVDALRAQPRDVSERARRLEAEVAFLRREREDVEAARRERDEARADRGRLAASTGDVEVVRRERDDARAELEQLRAQPSREAIRGELRQRDEALADRDAALAARDAAVAERDQVVQERDVLRRELQERDAIADGAARRREQALEERDRARREGDDAAEAARAERDAARRAVHDAEERAADRERRRAQERLDAMRDQLVAAEEERDRALAEPAGVTAPPMRVPREHETESSHADWAARTAAILAVLVLLVLAITFLKAIA